MADKRQVKKNIRRLRIIKTWQLVILLVIMSVIAATFLRLNNVNSGQRREAILAADKAGNIDDINQRIFALQRFSAAHMNASQSLYLQGQYDRNVKAIMDKAMAQTDGDSAQKKADEICKPRYHGFSTAYMQCFIEEVDKIAPTDNSVKKIEKPDPQLYHHSYVSPLWTPDFAGWSILICGIILITIILRAISLGVLHVMLKHHYRGI